MNISPSIIQTVQQCFSSFYEGQKAPGLVYAITHKGQAVHAASFGDQKVTPHEPMVTSSLSRIAWMTKSFAAVAALRLRDAGVVDIDAPISAIAKGSSS